MLAYIDRKGTTQTKRKTTSQLIAESRRDRERTNKGSEQSERKSWLDTVEYYSEEEKIFKGLVVSIARKEHKCPTEIEQWCLPDIVLVYSTYIDEAEQIKSIEEEINLAE